MLTLFKHQGGNMLCEESKLGSGVDEHIAKQEDTILSEDIQIQNP